MKKLQYYRYGNSSVMKLDEVIQPKPKSGEVLIKVKGAAINPIDFKLRKGLAFFMPAFGFPKGMGVDFSGTVVELGGGVESFNIDDEVFGWVDYGVSGTFAEYVIAKAKLIVKKPASISFKEAAALPMVTCTALTALVRHAKIKEGMKVLINGCTGGVGHVAVQIAKAYGAHVVGTCSQRNIDKAKHIRVDEAIDYKHNEIEKYKAGFDIVLDTPGLLPYSKAKRLMKGKSTFVSINPKPEMIWGTMASVWSGQQYRLVMAKATPDLLLAIQSLVTEEKLKPIVGKTFSFSEAIAAVRFIEEGGKATGKVVMVMDD